MTPPPLTDCFLLSLLLNYFSSDSHMWVFSSLAGRLTLWRRESEAQQTGEASVCFKRERETQCMCQCQRKTGAGSRDVAPTPLFLLRLRSCGALPPPSPTVAAPSWAKNGPTAGQKGNASSIHLSAISHIACPAPAQIITALIAVTEQISIHHHIKSQLRVVVRKCSTLGSGPGAGLERNVGLGYE